MEQGLGVGLFLVDVAELGETLVEPGWEAGIAPASGLGHQNVGQLVGGDAGDGGLVAQDEDNPLVGPCHALGYQVFADGLRAEGKGTAHITVVVIGDDTNGDVGVDPQDGGHLFNGLHRGFQHDFGTLLDEFGQAATVVVDGDESLGELQPLEPAVLVDDLLFGGPYHTASGVAQLIDVGDGGAGRDVLAGGAGLEGVFAADLGTRGDVKSSVGEGVAARNAQ